MDAVEFGFFEIAVDMERIAVHDGPHWPPCTDELLGSRRAVVDVTVHRAADNRAIEVQLRAVYRNLGFHQRHLCAGHPGLAFFQLFDRHQIAKALVTLGFTLGLGQGFLAVCDRRFRLAQGQFETVLVDAEQHLAALYQLVVAHLHLLDQPGYVWRDLHDVGPDVPVTGPGREHVVHHHAPDHDHGESYDQQGQDHATKG